MADGTGLHKDNVDHTIKVTAKTPPRLQARLLGLFHDVGKPPTRIITSDGVTFHGHEAKGASITSRVLERLGFSPEASARVSRLVKISGSTKGSLTWSDSAVRRFVVEAGDLLDDLLDFANVDVTSRHEANHEKVRDEVATLRRRIVEVSSADEAAKWRPVLSGDDIMARYSLSPGKEVGQLLRELSALQRTIEAAGNTLSVEEAWAELGRFVSRTTK
jgi:poly(A) polymerase